MTEEYVREDLRHARNLHRMREHEGVEKIKEKYADAIASLNEIERVIILEGIIGGMHYCKIGQKYHYSESSIKSYARSAVSKIAARMK